MCLRVREHTSPQHYSSFSSFSSELLTVFLFGIRAFVTGVFQAVYVYTPEVYPTAVRGIGMGINTSIARIGAIITPFVAQVRNHVSNTPIWHAFLVGRCCSKSMIM